MFSAIILGVRNFRVFEILEHLPYAFYGKPRVQVFVIPLLKNLQAAGAKSKFWF